MGWGGVTAVAEATHMSPSTVRAGIAELKAPRRGKAALPPERIRRPGGGRRRAILNDPQLLPALDGLVEPTSRGDPESPLRWTIKSTRTLAEELARQTHPVSHSTVATLLDEAGYSLQGNRKTHEGASHPDRNAQFEHLSAEVARFLNRGQPAISVDTKKKELVGDFKNGGRDWRPQGQPEEVRVHDFRDPLLGKAIPYGVYDIFNNQGWVSIGIDHDTAAFAVNTIRRWWKRMGRRRFPKAWELFVTADSGGSNSAQLPIVEGRLAGIGRRDRAEHHHRPPSAGNEQVEQDRTPHVLVHHAKLAWPAAGEFADHRGIDRAYADCQGIDGSRRVGHQHVPQRD